MRNSWRERLSLLWRKCGRRSRSLAICLGCGLVCLLVLIGRAALIASLPAVPHAAVSGQESFVPQSVLEIKETQKETEPPASLTQIEDHQSDQGMSGEEKTAIAVASFDPAQAVIPVMGEVVREPGWYRHPLYGDWRLSPGIEIKPEKPGEEVVSSYDGVVTQVSKSRTGGWDVVLTHGDDWRSEYRGLEEVVVEPMQTVAGGSLLGTSMKDDQAAVAFVLRRGDDLVDPRPYLPQP
ncbi:MAG: M23 family metallopeptidase [Firmicutes bacterium]|nr:M23 family metallopeptidase [Bacillota bacterium]